MITVRRNGHCFVILAAVLWGTTGTAQALAPAGASPPAIGAIRLAIGGAALLMLAAGRGVLRRGLGLPVGATLTAAACMASYQITFFASVVKTGVATGTVVALGSAPIMAGLLAYLIRGERLGRRWGLATILAVGGCALLAISTNQVRVKFLGVLLALGAGFAYALYSVVSKGLLEGRPPDGVMAVIFSLSALFLSPVLLTQDLSWLLQARGIAVALHLGLITTAVAYLLFSRGLISVPVSTAVTLSLAEPLTAASLGIIVLGEIITLPAGLGMGLILCGLAILSLRPPRPPT